jgi:hypothetical protein
MKLCCVIQHPLEEAIDFILAASAFTENITVILMGEGIALRNTKSFAVMPEYGITNIIMADTGDLSTIKMLIHNHDRIINF